MGKRAALVPCNDIAPDFELFPELDALLQERLKGPAMEATEADWQALRNSVLDRK